MDKEYLSNPLNRRKKKYKYYFRKIENILKLILIYLIIFPISLPFLIRNYFFNKLYFFKDFINHNGIVFLVFIFKNIHNRKFLIKIKDFHKVFSRFGITFLLKNFSLNFKFKQFKSISFVNDKCDIFFNTDYFYYFDKKVKLSENNFVLPFYLPKKYYLENSYQNFKDKNKTKKFKIIFSGSVHNDWYGNLSFLNNVNEKFLNRVEIMNIIKENFSDKIQIINNPLELNTLKNTKKEIILIETNPETHLRKKLFSEKQHLDLISSSNFFLCMPGTSMPLSYHLIECCMSGTVPILSYNDFLYPKFKTDEALFYFKKKELIDAINVALNIDNSKYLVMQSKILQYYNDHLDPKNISKKILNKNYPLEVYVNLDHISTKKRENRVFNIDTD